MAFDHMTTAAEPRLSTVLVRESELGYSREAVTIRAGAGAKRLLKMGTVIGKAILGAPTVEPDPGNTGRATLTLHGTQPLLPGAERGIYRVVCLAAILTGGTFEVFSPRGYSLGRFDIPYSFDNHLSFDLQLVTTEFVVGDLYRITIPRGTGEVVALDPAAVDGTQYAYGVMSMDGEAPDGAAGAGQAIAREAVVTDTGLIWPAGITAYDRIAATERLQDRKIHIAKAI